MTLLYEQLARYINAITAVQFIALATVYAVGLYLAELVPEAQLFALSLLILLIAIKSLKVLTNVKRPADMYLAAEPGAFPSGHSALAAFTALMVPYTLAHTLQPVALALLTALLVAIALVVATSRLSVHAHTAVQVVAGVTLGILVPLILILFF